MFCRQIGDEIVSIQLNSLGKREIRSVEHGICPIAEFIGDSASKGQIAYLFIANARNGHTSTFGQNI